MLPLFHAAIPCCHSMLPFHAAAMLPWLRRDAVVPCELSPLLSTLRTTSHVLNIHPTKAGAAWHSTAMDRWCIFPERNRMDCIGRVAQRPSWCLSTSPSGSPATRPSPSVPVRPSKFVQVRPHRLCCLMQKRDDKEGQEKRGKGSGRTQRSSRMEGGGGGGGKGNEKDGKTKKETAKTEKKKKTRSGYTSNRAYIRANNNPATSISPSVGLYMPSGSPYIHSICCSLRKEEWRQNHGLSREWNGMRKK